MSAWGFQCSRLARVSMGVWSGKEVDCCLLMTGLVLQFVSQTSPPPVAGSSGLDLSGVVLRRRLFRLAVMHFSEADVSRLTSSCCLESLVDPCVGFWWSTAQSRTSAQPAALHLPVGTSGVQAGQHTSLRKREVVVQAVLVMVMRVRGRKGPFVPAPYLCSK